jgi:hypothetical protein
MFKIRYEGRWFQVRCPACVDHPGYTGDYYDPPDPDCYYCGYPPSLAYDSSVSVFKWLAYRTGLFSWWDWRRSQLREFFNRAA